MLGLGLQLPGGGTIVSSNAEIAELADGLLKFFPGLGDRTEVWLRTDRTVTGANTRAEGELIVVTGPAGADLVIEFP
jgi:beta-galactosidase